VEATQHGWHPVDPPRRPVLFVNPWSGDGRAEREGIPERARKRGIDVVVLSQGESLAALVEEAVAARADALGMAGGDGSLALVADAAEANGIPFACIPTGTYNHFALDVGVDRHDVVGALDAFTDGVERLIDTAEVNGRLYLNNVSLGIYGDAVRKSGYRDARARTLLDTVNEVTGPSGALPEIELTDDEGREHRHPTVVLVSNNPYALGHSLAPGSRPRLDTGELGVVVVHGPRSDPRSLGRAWTTPSLAVNGAETLHAGIDGEAVDLNPPLAFASRPLSLRVRISARHPGVSPAGAAPRGPSR
jgi:diacylglycerol kinase family enzyme